MLKFVKRTSQKAGLGPGSLVHVGEKRSAPVGITLMAYDAEHLEECELTAAEAAPLSHVDKTAIRWLNVDGVHRPDVVENIGAQFNVHPLTLEDILNTTQRPKIEDYDEYLYVVLKMLYYDAAENELRSEQISLILADQLLISFQEVQGDVFESVRQRLRNTKSRIRKSGSDYLLYAMLDALVDRYFVILESIGDQIEQLEEELLEGASTETLARIHELKREMVFFRKQVRPVRDILMQLSRDDTGLIHPGTRLFYNDVYDHIAHVIETVESFRDLLSGIQELYLSMLSNRMNEVMKVLTIIATIFIPITFIAGVYGMNFAHMPELQWPWGYGAVWGVMLGVAGLLLVYFKRQKWL